MSEIWKCERLTSLRWHQVQTPHRATSQTAQTTNATDTRNTLRDTEPERGERERETGDRQRHREDRVSAVQQTFETPHVGSWGTKLWHLRQTYGCNQRWCPVMCLPIPSLLPSLIHPCHLASVISEMHWEWVGNDIKAQKALSAHVPRMYQ